MTTESHVKYPTKNAIYYVALKALLASSGAVLMLFLRFGMLPKVFESLHGSETKHSEVHDTP